MSGVIAAAGIGAAGAIGSAVLPKLMGGSGSSAGQTSGNTNTATQSGPALGSPYLGFENEQLANISGLSNAPFKPYDVNAMFAPFNNFQNNAFGQVQGAANGWQPSSAQAFGTLGRNTSPSYDPVAASNNAFGASFNSPTAQGASGQNLGAAGQSAPSVIQNYLDPNIRNTVSAGNQLQTQNFLQNVMPGLTNQFVASGGGLGSPQMGNAQNWAMTNFNQNLGNTDQQALQASYQNSMGAAQNDLSRFGQVGATQGNLALGQQNAYTGLGTAEGNQAMAGNSANVANANAYAGLGTGWLNNSLLGANAQLQVGNQIQQNAQNPLTAAYNQFEQAQQWPYQTAGWAANTANQYQWPMQQTSESSNTGTSAGQVSSTGSPIGTGLGLAAGVGSLFPQSNGSTPNPVMSGNNGPLGGQQFGPPAPAKRGGYFKGFADGGSVSGFYGLPEGDGYSRDLAGNMSDGGMGFMGITRASLPWVPRPYTPQSDGPQIGYGEGGKVVDFLANVARRQSELMEKHGAAGDRSYRYQIMPEAENRERWLGHQYYNARDLPDNVTPMFPTAKAHGGYLGLNVPEYPSMMEPFGPNEGGPQIGLARGGFYGLDRASQSRTGYFMTEPQVSPQDGPQVGYAKGGSLKRGGFYATGGTVPVIKVARANTRRAIKHSEAAQQAAARRGIDLSPSSGHFAQ